MNPFSILTLIILLLVAFFGLFALIGIGSLFLPRSEEEYKGKKAYSYRRKQFFMTRAENDFYQGLVKAVGDRYAIFPQVHLPMIVDEKIPGQDWRAARARINRKSVDFVLCDKQYLNPKLAIELDDASHEREDRQERDGFVQDVLRMAQFPLLRIRHSENISVDELASRINIAIQVKS